MDASTTVSALQQFLTSIGSVISAATGWIGDLIGVVMDNPVLLVPIGLTIAASVIGLFHRLKS